MSTDGCEACSTVSDPTKRLPLELKHAVLDIVTQPTVLHVAAVCRHWNAAATTHFNFYRYVYIDWSLHDPIAQLVTDLERARQTNRRVSLKLDCVGIDDYIHQRDRRPFWDVVRIALRPALESAFQTSIISLYISLNNSFIQPLYSVLMAPAPLLRAFTLNCSDDELTSDLYPDLFAGYAPCLRSLVLLGLTAPHIPVPAFSSAVNVKISAEEHIGDIPFSTTFPRALIVDLSVIGLPGSFETTCIDLRNTAIHRLNIRSLYRDVHVPWIPPVRMLGLHGFTDMNFSPHWDALVGPLVFFVGFSFSPHAREWSIKASSLAEDRFVAISWPSQYYNDASIWPWSIIAHRLSDIRDLQIDQSGMETIFRLCSRFPALVFLRINVQDATQSFYLPKIRHDGSLHPPLKSALTFPSVREVHLSSDHPWEALRIVSLSQAIDLGRAILASRPLDSQEQRCDLYMHSLRWGSGPGMDVVTTLFTRIVAL